MYTNYEYTRTNEIAAVETFPETSQKRFERRFRKRLYNFTRYPPVFLQPVCSMSPRPASLLDNG